MMSWLLTLPGEERQTYRVHKMESFIERARGLLFQSGISAGEVYWFDRCSSVHMFGMRFPIDVVFLDKQFSITKIVSGLKPWRFSYSLGSRSVLEMKSGESSARQMKVGQVLEFQRVEDVKNV
ncbi:DUF192 domain-containing protein [Arenicella chitinivorans]|nr:DUF192 domain-containing protein [Arenicella chitinivorans]